MLLKFLLIVHCFLPSCADHIDDKDKWAIKYLSNTNGGKYNRALNGYEFDHKLYEIDIPPPYCSSPNIAETVGPFWNDSLHGYVYCSDRNKGLLEICPPGTKVRYGVSGCVNITTNTTVFPVGSRCQSNPCQNGGLCFDFPSADAYVCHCYHPYMGVHCQIHERRCARFACGNTTSDIMPQCFAFPSDKALHHICNCYMLDTKERHVALNNCHNEKLFWKDCDKAERVGALPFTNKGFYICGPSGNGISFRSCDLHHVWNDTQKECVPE